MWKNVRTDLIFTCEHGGNRIPPEFQAEFRGSENLLHSHRGWDPGSLELARTLAREFSAPLFFSQVSRLLVELNRSQQHPRLFSEISTAFQQARKEQLLKLYYRPFRRKILEAIRENLSDTGRVIHISVHTFAPLLNGRERNADVGILYDPKRKTEAEFCKHWKNLLNELAPQLRVRRNYPYRGKADGHTTALRKQFSAEQYLGIELEVNQKHPLGAPQSWRRLKREIATSLRRALDN